MCVSDNEWKLPRPSTAGRRLRLSDVTVSPHCLLLIHQRTFFHLDQCVWLWLWWCVCISGWFSVLFFSFVGFYFGHNHERLVPLTAAKIWTVKHEVIWVWTGGCSGSFARGEQWTKLNQGRIKREAAEDVEIDISLSPASYNYVCLNKTIIWVRADFIKVKTQRRKHIVQTTLSSRLAASAWHNALFLT